MEFNDLFKKDLKDIPFITPKEFFQMLSEFRKTVKTVCLGELCGSVDDDCHIDYERALDIRQMPANHGVNCIDL